jgi:MFS family permease
MGYQRNDIDTGMCDHGNEDDRSSSKSIMEDFPTETSPLLRPIIPERRDTLGSPTQKHHSPSRRTITVLICLAVILSSCGTQLTESPQTRIMESIICYRHYEVHDPSKILVGRGTVGPGAIGGVDEHWCKEDAIQEQLAMLRGYQQLLDGFPSLFLALPFGWAADRFGRKPFILLNVLAIVLKQGWVQFVTWYWQAFDLRMAWLSTITGLLGGGDSVLSALVFVILSDITLESQRAGMFFRVGAFNLTANLAMPPLSAWSMAINPWIPGLIGTFLVLVTVQIISMIPETLHFHGEHLAPTSHSDLATRAGDREPGIGPAKSTRKTASFKRCSARWLNKIKESTSFLTDDWRVPVLIVLFLGHILIAKSTQLLLQYVSKRYRLSFAKGTLLLTIFQGTKVVLLFLILPYLSTAVMKCLHLSSQRKDLYLSRISLGLIALGWTFIGLSSNVPAVAVSMTIASLGQGAYLLVRSFLTALVPAHHIASVYSIISMVDTVGAMFGGALLADLFQVGMAMGGLWVGLPFYFLGLTTAVFLLLMCLVGLRKGEDGHTAHEDD